MFLPSFGFWADGAIGIGIAASVAAGLLTRSPVVLVAGGVAAFLLNKKRW
jgi:hypothetical protein